MALRRILRSLLCLLLFSASATFVFAQAMTSITATSVNSGVLPTNGKVCLMAVDAFGNAIPVTKSGGGFYRAASQFCQTLTAGALSASLSVPNPLSDHPTGHGYAITTYDNASGTWSDPINVFSIGGATWSLDNYQASATVPTTPAFTFTTGSGAHPGFCTSPAIDVRVTGGVADMAICSGGSFIETSSSGTTFSGGNITGNTAMGSGATFTLAQDPVSDLQAATKRYVDSHSTTFNGGTIANATTFSSTLTAGDGTMVMKVGSNPGGAFNIFQLNGNTGGNPVQVIGYPNGSMEFDASASGQFLFYTLGGPEIGGCAEFDASVLTGKNEGCAFYAGAYSASFTYPIGTIVTSSGTAYISLIASNHGNTPSSSPSDWQPLSGSSSAPRVVYTSSISGATGGQAVTAGSSSTGDPDSAAAINAVLAGGNVDLEVNSGYALSTSLVLGSNTTVHCTSPQYGFIMLAASNVPVVVNAHQNAPTTSNGTGGYVVSNQADRNIQVLGCTLTPNATQAVTGTNLSSVPHAVNSSGVVVMGVQFIGVNGLTFRDDSIYDSGAYAIFLANDSFVHIEGSSFSQPSPIVQEKNTDGIHFVGPDSYLWVENNFVNAGDDSIALNADDCNELGSAPCMVPGVKWGNIQHAYIEHNVLSSSFGVRLLDGASLLDDVSVTDTRGNVCGNAFTMMPFFALGNGNIGQVKVDGWSVQTSGTCNVFSQPYNFELGLNAQSLSIGNVTNVNPQVGWPEIETFSGDGTIQQLNLHDFNIVTTASTFSPSVVVTNGAVGQLQASNIGWYDTLGGASFFSGSAVPGLLTVSNYAGPNALLASGYNPAIKNGDAFSNTYVVTTTYFNTTFNEGSTGANLAGTTPATCANGCAGPWTLAAGSDFTYQAGGGISNSTNNGSNWDLITVGVTNYVLRAHVSVLQSGLQFLMRYTDTNNYTVVNVGPSSIDIFDDVAGSFVHRAGPLNGSTIGDISFTLNGTSLTISAPAGTLTGTISNTGTKAGFDNSGTTGQTSTITSMSAKSN